MVTSFIMAVSCSVIFDFAAAMLDVERFERGGYVLVVFIYIRVGSTARGGCVTGAAGEMNAASRGRPENSTLKQCCPVLLRRLASRCGAGTCWQTDVLTDRADTLVLTSRGCLRVRRLYTQTA